VASMEYKHQQQATRSWTTRRDEKKRRMQLVSSWMNGPPLPQEKLVESLEARDVSAKNACIKRGKQR
jgi:malonate decarboxylase alpha subunit